MLSKKMHEDVQAALHDVADVVDLWEPKLPPMSLLQLQLQTFDGVKWGEQQKQR